LASSTTPTAIDRPGRIVRQAGGFDLTFGLARAITSAAGTLLVTSIPPNAAGALLSFFTLMLALRTFTFWPRYLGAASILARAGKLPFRAARFLDWAYSVGLLRISGIAVQFRHVELQNWLTSPQQNNT